VTDPDADVSGAIAMNGGGQGVTFATLPEKPYSAG